VPPTLQPSNIAAINPTDRTRCDESGRMLSRIDLAERHLDVPKKDTAMWELFKQFSVSARVGLVCGLLGGLLGAVVGIAAAPVAGSIFVGGGVVG